MVKLQAKDVIVDAVVYQCKNCLSMAFTDYGEFRPCDVFLNYAVQIICPHCQGILHLKEVPLKRKP